MVTKTHGLDLTISKLSLMFTERMKGATLSAVKKKKKNMATEDRVSSLMLNLVFIIDVKKNLPLMFTIEGCHVFDASKKNAH